MSTPHSDQENSCSTPTRTTAYGKEVEADNPEDWFWVIEKEVEIVTQPEEKKAQEPRWKAVQLGMQKKLKELDIRSLDATKELHRRLESTTIKGEKVRKRPNVQEVQEGLEKKLPKIFKKVPKKVAHKKIGRGNEWYEEARNRAMADFPELFKQSC